MISITTNLEDHKAMSDLANALEISDNNLETDKEGKFALFGRDDKELKIIQHIDDLYFYYFIADSKRRRTFLKNKLTAFGMKKELESQSGTDLYLSMKRLPEPSSEAPYIRQLLGFRTKRSTE